MTTRLVPEKHHVSSSEEASRRFRPEIEGLRAVAAALVAVYHVFLGRVSGGVDIFFTVAGFLITLTLLRQLDRSGAVSARLFFSRLARRLLPASLLVLAATAMVTAFLLPESRRSATFAEIVASALYVENWALAAKSVDYLARDEGASPVQHFWAMSIQGQFYVIWITVFVIAAAFGRRRAVTALGVMFGGLFVVSMSYSVYLTSVNQPLAYFHTGARVWEFAAGGAVALGIARIDRVPARLARLLGWLGLALVISCGLVLQVSELFPGWVALWPVAGGILILASSAASGRGTVAGILGSRPLTTLGGMSYAIYLWHWPILVVYLARTGRTVAPLLPGLAILALTLVLAYVTTRFIERPVRQAVAGSSWGRRSAGLMVAVLVVLVGWGVLGSRTGPESPVAAGGDQHPGPRAVASGWADQPSEYSEPPVPALAVAKADRPAVYDLGCHVGPDVGELKTCSFGDPGGDVTVMLLGGSHSAHWQPALEIVANDRGWHLISATKSGCRFTTEPHAREDIRESCREWNDAALAEVERIRPDYVFTTSTFALEPSDETVPPGYIERWAQLDELGVDVLAIRDTPRAASNQVECLEASASDEDRCGVARQDVYLDVDPVLLLEPAPSNVTFLDLSDLMCDAQWCPALIGNVVVYSDSDHLTATWSRSLAPYLDERIPRRGEGEMP